MTWTLTVLPVFTGIHYKISQTPNFKSHPHVGITVQEDLQDTLQTKRSGIFFIYPENSIIHDEVRSTLIKRDELHRKQSFGCFEQSNFLWKSWFLLHLQASLQTVLSAFLGNWCRCSWISTRKWRLHFFKSFLHKIIKTVHREFLC